MEPSTPCRAPPRVATLFAHGLAALTIGLGIAPWMTPGTPAWAAWLALAAWEALAWWHRGDSSPRAWAGVLTLWAAAGLALAHEMALITLNVMSAKIAL